jgi:hypothetical protein
MPTAAPIGAVSPIYSPEITPISGVALSATISAEVPERREFGRPMTIQSFLDCNARKRPPRSGRISDATAGHSEQVIQAKPNLVRRAVRNVMTKRFRKSRIAIVPYNIVEIRVHVFDFGRPAPRQVGGEGRPQHQRPFDAASRRPAILTAGGGRDPTGERGWARAARTNSTARDYASDGAIR